MPTPLSPLFNFTTQPAIVRKPPAGVVEAPKPPTGAPGGSGGFGPPAPIPVCPAGTYYDPYANACVSTGITLTGNFPTPTVPVITPTTTVTAGEPTTVGGEGPIYVNTQNTVQITDQSAAGAIGSVAYAVNQGIQQAASNASSIAQYTASQVQSSIDGLTSTLDQGIQQAYQSISGVASGITNGVSTALGSIGSTIGNDLFNAINPVSIGLAQIIDVISRQIGGLAGQIGDSVARIIPLIVAAIQGAISPSQATIAAIGTEISTALGQLTQATGQVSGGLGSIDATLGRILLGYEGFTEAQTGYPDGGNLHHDLSNIVKALAGLVAVFTGTATVRASDHIQSVCGEKELTDLLNRPWIPPDVNADPWQGAINAFMKAVIGGLFYAASILPALAKVNEEVRQRFDQACPFEPLPHAAVVDAVQRGFLPQSDGEVEAAKGDLSASRFKVLQDLAKHQLSPQQLVEGLYRGYISQGDFQSALAAQGWTAGQQAILQGLFVEQIRPATYNSLNELRQRGYISDTDYQQVLQKLGFDPGQQTLLTKLVFRPSTLGEATDGAASFDALTGVGAGGAFGIPEYASAAAAAEGLDQQATQDRWLAHWNLGAIGEWIQLYFRGLATQSQLQAVFIKNQIPGEIQRLLVDGTRPLIQFRTITRLVGLKLMSPAEGLAQLQRHGYSPQDAQTLINYAIATAKVPAAQRAAQTHAVSLNIAKEEYIDGSISAAQFYDVLIAHGFTADGANTEIAVINAHEAMLQRKANAQLVVDEYGAGIINEQVALAQLAALGLTVAEIAKYAHKIRAFRTKNAKLPTEAELLKMLKANVITADTYKSTLVAEGYSAQWADAFYQVGTSVSPPPAGAATPATTPAPATP